MSVESFHCLAPSASVSCLPALTPQVKSNRVTSATSKISSSRLGRNERADRALVTVEILFSHAPNVVPSHFANAVKIAVHLPPSTGRFIKTDLHRLALNRVLREYEGGFDLILGFLQFALADHFIFHPVNL